MSVSPIPKFIFGNDGQPLYFFHANGYPPPCYRPFLSQLAKTNYIVAMVQRPLWKDSRPEDLHDWNPFTDDLLRFLDENASSGPITAVGHSLGGIATLRAALREPERFCSIILLDPVLLPPYFILIWRLALRFNFAHRLHPHLSTTLQRRREFNDLDRAFRSYRRRSTFRFMSDESLRNYIEGMTYQTEGGSYKLWYSPEWETRVYYASIWSDMDIWRQLSRLEVPTLIIRGKETDTFWENTGKLVQRKQPNIRVEALEKATHLVPLERPNQVANLIRSFCEEYP